MRTLLLWVYFIIYLVYFLVTKPLNKVRQLFFLFFEVICQFRGLGLVLMLTQLQALCALTEPAVSACLCRWQCANNISVCGVPATAGSPHQHPSCSFYFSSFVKTLKCLPLSSKDTRRLPIVSFTDSFLVFEFYVVIQTDEILSPDPTSDLTSVVKD